MKLTYLAILLSLSAFAQTESTKVEVQKKEGEKSSEVFSTGPYKDGVYTPSLNEEQREAEEAILEENQDETRVNKIGPNKR